MGYTGTTEILSSLLEILRIKIILRSITVKITLLVNMNLMLKLLIWLRFLLAPKKLWFFLWIMANSSFLEGCRDPLWWIVRIYISKGLPICASVLVEDIWWRQARTALSLFSNCSWKFKMWFSLRKVLTSSLMIFWLMWSW